MTDHVALRPQHPRTVAALCGGVLGLERGVKLAVPELRLVVAVERQAHAAAVVAARMGSGAVDPAPVWDDLESFDGRPFRGCVDLVTAGFPCQPASVAGDREGLDDERWLWPLVWRVTRDLGARYLFIENVPGLLSVSGGGAFEEILGDLAAGGWDAQWDCVPAATVGAPHARDRLYLLAADADRVGVRLIAEWDQRPRRRERAPERQPTEPVDDGAARAAADPAGGGPPLGTERVRRGPWGRDEEREAGARGVEAADPDLAVREPGAGTRALGGEVGRDADAGGDAAAHADDAPRGPQEQPRYAGADADGGGLGADPDADREQRAAGGEEAPRPAGGPEPDRVVQGAPADADGGRQRAGLGLVREGEPDAAGRGGGQAGLDAGEPGPQGDGLREPAADRAGAAAGAPQPADPDRQGLGRQRRRRKLDGGERAEPGRDADRRGRARPGHAVPESDLPAGVREQLAALRDLGAERWDWRDAPLPLLRRVDDGLAGRVDGDGTVVIDVAGHGPIRVDVGDGYSPDHADRLHACGNGVADLGAAFAWVVLWYRLHAG